MPRSFDLDTLLRIPTVVDFDISPDGKHICFVWNKTGRLQLYLLTLPEGAIEQLTFDPESKMAPRFSPNGEKLAYAQDYRGNEKFDLFVMDLAPRKSVNTTPETDFAIYPHIRWSPDGKSMAFASNRTGKFSIYSMPSSGGEATMLCDHEYSDSDPEWSPDGRYAAFTSLIKGQDQGVFIVPSKGGEPVQICDREEPVESFSPDWSPDSGKIAFVSSSKGSYDIGLYDVEGRRVQWLTDSRHESVGPSWSRDGRFLAFLVNRDGNVSIATRNKEGATRFFEAGPGVHSRVGFTPDSSSVVFIYSGPKKSLDLWVINLDDGTTRQLTNSLPPSISPEIFVVPRIVKYPTFDRRLIPASLYLPQNLPEGQLAPAILWVHGGPTAQHRNDWYAAIQHLVNQGFVVLAPNYRGSTGYGREFREANRFVLGRDDLADVMAGAEFLKAQGIGDPARIGITGASYGGYLTMCALTKYPEKWAAGSALFPFLNWFTEVASEREDLQYWDRENMGDPVRDKERFREASPIFHMDRIKAPVQIIAGKHDPRCPASEAEQAREALAKLGVDFEFKIYHDEGHGFRKLENMVDAFKKRAFFFEKHLIKKGP